MSLQEMQIQEQDPFYSSAISGLEGLSEITVECANKDKGCQEKVALDKIDWHEKHECQYRMVYCTRINCQTKDKMEAHLLKIHHDFECVGLEDSANNIQVINTESDRLLEIQDQERRD